MPNLSHLLHTTALAALTMPATGMRLHGSQQTRSPLVNWFAAEAGLPLTVMPPRPSNHPFGQVPFFTDEGGVEVFESGAILLYLADAAAPSATAADRAKYTKWVMWANSELDGLCFGAVPGDHRVRGTSMDKKGVRSVERLEEILGECEWLVDNSFTVADVAVGSYLNYVPLFFPSTDMSGTPNIVRYMERCATRPAFAQAFGEGHASSVRGKCATWLGGGAKQGGPFGMFK